MHLEDRSVTCDSLWDLLSAYADGETTPDEAALVEQHVAVCSACARDLLFMRQAASALADTPEVSPPPDLRQAILTATIYRPTWRQRLQTALCPLFASPVRMSALGLAGVAVIVLGLMRMPWQRPLPSTPTEAGTSSSAPSITRLAERPESPRPSMIQREPAPKRPLAISPASRPRNMERLLARANSSWTAAHAASQARPTSRADRTREETRRLPPGPRGGHRTEDGEPSRLRPSLIAPTPAEPSAMERAPEEVKTPERMVTADLMPLPPRREEDEERPRADTSDAIQIKLASASRTMSAGPVSSLADLRRTLRRENEATLSNVALFSPGDRPGMMLAVIKTRF